MEMRMERWMCGISLSDGSAVGCRIPKKQVRVTLFCKTSGSRDYVEMPHLTV